MTAAHQTETSRQSARPRGWLLLACALERSGWAKYLVMAAMATAAFGLTVGAYLVDEAGKRPAVAMPIALAPARPPAAPVATHVVRQAATPSFRFQAAGTAGEEAGFGFYDITAAETPESLSAKLARKRFHLALKQADQCNFAYPLAADRFKAAPIAAFIRGKSEACCAVAGVLPSQIASYAFAQKGGRMAAGGLISGTAVFSALSGGILTLNIRFIENVSGYADTITKHMTARYGPPAALPGGAAWTRDGGLLSLARDGAALSVTAYFAANIERHATRARDLAERQYRPKPGGNGKLVAEGEQSEITTTRP